MVARAVTNADGRIDAPLIGGRPVLIATDELRFHISEHFRGAGSMLPESAFPYVVPIRFGVAEPERPYQARVASPWSDQTDRGR
ncbi:5-hydroxyisourate hydrolase-like protein (transthyretin family) [Methylobacterium sp. RAS18]|nr:5-hydroxyisourate hydrolase-like protein (transthyretin family) [Methylobacterium sp. RAS18]